MYIIIARTIFATIYGITEIADPYKRLAFTIQ